jgi:hypothetical protein
MISHDLCNLEAAEQFSRGFPENYSLAELKQMLNAAYELVDRLQRRVAYLQIQAAEEGRA